MNLGFVIENICSKELGSGQACSWFGLAQKTELNLKSIPNCFFGLVHCILKFKLN